jgi:nucleotide-binding universal stress UspA family protein
MTMLKERIGIQLKNILYLTDFSEPSMAALPFAAGLAHTYGAAVHALHVLTPAIPATCPEAVQADESLANTEMTKVDSWLADTVHDVRITHGIPLWPAVEQAIGEQDIDLIVMGTHGRTRAQKLLLGSFAEEIFRRSSVPVLTVGPGVRQNLAKKGLFDPILFATDFSQPCQAAAPFAVSVAAQNHARLILLCVVGEPGTSEESKVAITDIMEGLHHVVPIEARTSCHPVAMVKYGEPVDRILEVAVERDADLIVLGVRDAVDHMGAATHLDRATAHRVVVRARCPVLTVRG